MFHSLMLWLFNISKSGLVAVEQRKYILREAKLEPLIDEIEKDLVRYLDGLRSIARDIDHKMK